MTRLRTLAYAWRMGVRDGWEQPYELSCGLTFDDLDACDAYDFGVNLGQRLRDRSASQAAIHGYRIIPRRKSAIKGDTQ